MTLSSRLSDLIRDSGRTQTELAAAAGLRQSSLSMLLGGDRGGRMPADTLARLGRALGLSATALGKMLYESLDSER